MSANIQHLSGDLISTIVRRDGFSGTGSGSDQGDGSSGSSDSTPSHDDGGSSNNTLSIVLGVVLPASVAIVLLLYLHRRHVRKQRFEDARDKHGSLDFGLGEVHRHLRNKKKGGKKSMPEMTVTDMDAEKGTMRQIRGLSMDMGSPYIVAGDMHGRGSFNSLSRDREDPYRSVSMVRSASHSPSRPQTAKSSNAPSVYTGFNDENSKANLLKGAQTLPRSSPPRQDTADSTRSSSPTGFSTSALPENSASVSRKPVGLRQRGNSASAGTPASATIQEEPPLPMTKEEPTPELETGFNFSLPQTVDHRPIPAKTPSPPPQATASPPSERPDRTSSKPPRVPSIDGKISEPLPPSTLEEWTTYADVLGIVQEGPSEPQTHSMLAPNAYEQTPATNSLMVPSQHDERRLSASIRPLPPDDPLDNPEQRANRIRSFYKEYFDESKQTADNYGGGPEYYDVYEDYGQEYLNDATIYDPQTGQFVVAGGTAPFAQPVTRRAMTPPPRAPPQYRGGPRRPFSGSQGYGTPNPRMRAFSSASGRPGGHPRGRAPRRPMPPPAPLNTLPTPHMLGNDTSAFSTIDFAPPPNMRDIASGRPASPRGEQRPYSPTVRAHTPLVGAFNELSAMPSPHALGTSSTFTGLDFAPPPRFRDRDGSTAGSDNGSIRSGRSNRSAAQVYNIRNGAYRLSRLPVGAVGTKDDLMASLKPEWNVGR
ncbi:MAG: hypothetical protein M1828_007300 [Chrysothrix sp. TS-e1954]|nr:MAG: hypothetical protein M1828_007300 [Chrysothrix sp. TS-e1954]